MSKKTVIIGGVAGGATAAARLRRRDESMEIVMFERGEYISYANCGLPYYIGDVIKSRSNLLLLTPEAMNQKFNIDVRILQEVTKIQPEKKCVTVKNLKTGEVYEETYDQLIIATGSSPLKPPIPGIQGKNIHTLWTVPDTDTIKEAVRRHPHARAAVIGGGFIGLEMAENLHRSGMEVSIVEMQDQVMAPLDFEMAQLLHENLTMNHVSLYLGDGVEAFEEAGESTRIRLKSGKILEAELILLSIGVRPNSGLAKEAGISLNARGGIRVDQQMRTSIPDIYAVGDVVEIENFVTKEPGMIPLAGPANKQARLCGDNIAGDRKEYKGTLGASVAQVFDLSAGAVGVNEKTLKAMGKKKGTDYLPVLINQKSHAGYYPGASPMYLKLLFDRQGRILGAQGVGQDGVDKRIDTIAVAMRMGGTVYDLEELELSYAPPYSSAKDPVNMLGFTAHNVLDGLVAFTEWDELDEMLARKGDEFYTVLDVTEDVERMVFSIPGSVHIPLGQLRDRVGELPKDKPVVVYCAIGVRSYNGARILMQSGFSKVSVLAGGTAFYKSMHFADALGDAGHGADEGYPSTQGSNEGESFLSRDAGTEKRAESPARQVKILDCCGLQCPGPIMKVNETLSEMEEEEVLQVSATDMGFSRDVGAWCRRTGNTLLKTERKEGENIVYIQKGKNAVPSGCCSEEGASASGRAMAASPSVQPELPQGKTMVVFSGDLDKVLASFIIANGAAAMGRPVTMFFTFWGLNALRKPQKQDVKKSFIEKMFAFMMPRGSRKLKLSKMNMGGMGTSMMKKVMAKKNVSSLEELMEQALSQGVKLVACTMSMDIMGITKEELIDGVELAGVASYLGDAEESNVNLFI